MRLSTATEIKNIKEYNISLIAENVIMANI